MKILVLEDDVERIRQFRNSFEFLKGIMDIERIDYCDTAQNCIEMLKTTKYGLIFLDHDLGGEVFVNTDNTNTGSEVARWIEQNPLESGQQVILHTANPTGAQYMKNLIADSIHVPFVWVSEVFQKTFRLL